MVRRPKRGLRAAVLVIGVLAALSVPASASPQRVAASPTTALRTFKVMTWNACGGNNTGCRFYANPAELAPTVRRHMFNHEIPANAAIIQEFCSSYTRPLEHELEKHYGYGWDVRFAPIKIKRGADPAAAPSEQCDRGRGAYGLALAVPDENTWWEARYLPSAEGAEWRVALCATVESWRVKLCNAHLSYGGDDPTGAFRARQVPEYLAHVRSSRYRVIFGGDLNLLSGSTELAPAYDGFVECAQADQASPRGGPGTFYTTSPHNNAKTIKIDYLFTSPGLAHSCAVPSEVVEASDHRPLWIAVSLPTN
jgi:endonuclease/exonuclease/phosphatase family metal-dependent hydrolase